MAAALDLLGRRWALRIVWELRLGRLGFRPLQDRCDGMSPSVLSQRLAELREAGLAIREGDGTHRLTATGEELAAVLAPLAEWAGRRAADGQF